MGLRSVKRSLQVTVLHYPESWVSLLCSPLFRIRLWSYQYRTVLGLHISFSLKLASALVSPSWSEVKLYPEQVWSTPSPSVQVYYDRNSSQSCIFSSYWPAISFTSPLPHSISHTSHAISSTPPWSQHQIWSESAPTTCWPGQFYTVQLQHSGWLFPIAMIGLYILVLRFDNSIRI